MFHTEALLRYASSARSADMMEASNGKDSSKSKKGEFIGKKEYPTER